MKTIAPAELQKLLAAQPGLPLLDVRTPVKYAEVHVPQARNVPLDKLSPKALFDAGQLPKDQPVYLLCRSGGRAIKAAEQFAREGFDQGIVVEDGTQAWLEAGLPVIRGTARVISLERQVRIAAGSLVLIGVLLHISFIPVSSPFRRLWARDSFLPASPTGAAWACCWRSCRGTKSQAAPPVLVAK